MPGGATSANIGSRIRDGYPARPGGRGSVNSAPMGAYAVARLLPGASIGHGRHARARGVGGGRFDYHPVQPPRSAELAQIAGAARMRNGGN
jgi:hypothetical protein